MAVPVLVDEIHVEGGITAFAVNSQGGLVAIASDGMVGLYEVKETPEKTCFCHRGSFVATTDETLLVHKLTFDPKLPVLYVQVNDGSYHKVSLEHQQNGTLQVLHCSCEELDALGLRS